MVAVTYQGVMGRVAAAAARSGRDPDAVVVVVVSKGRSPEEIMDVYRKGHRDFGENRAQDLVAKAAELPSDIRWHFVGALQTNKARSVRPIATLLHSLDRRELAAAWMKGQGLPPPALVQVNVGGEPQKAGVLPDDAIALVEEVSSMGVEVRGLMTVPPIPEHPESSRPHFRRLAELGASISSRLPGAVELSMGMTDDFEVAIEEGGTIIRVGRAIFERELSTGA
jgi:PLP dependent protein